MDEKAATNVLSATAMGNEVFNYFTEGNAFAVSALEISVSINSTLLKSTPLNTAPSTSHSLNKAPSKSAPVKSTPLNTTRSNTAFFNVLLMNFASSKPLSAKVVVVRSPSLKLVCLPFPPYLKMLLLNQLR